MIGRQGQQFFNSGGERTILNAEPYNRGDVCYLTELAGKVGKI